MLPDGVSNPGPLTYGSIALPIALRGPAPRMGLSGKKLGQTHCKVFQQSFLNIHISSTTGKYPSTLVI